MSIYDTLRLISQELVSRAADQQRITPELIREQVQIAIQLVPGALGTIDADVLTKDLESRFSMWIGVGSILESGEGHIPWLASRKGGITWEFWERYREFLLADDGFEPVVVQRLNDLTDNILERLEDPLRDGAWLRKGLVVGQVQSGKTANYSGLICKSLDAGYKLIVVLTGIHNSLRSQTQLRLDESIIGFDTRRQLAINTDDESHRVGVGARPWPRTLVVHSLTTSAQSGDFKRQIADNAGIIPGSDPLILVVKKNASVLKNLLEWAKAVAGHRDETQGTWKVRNVPLLLIDDEADIASINTKKIPVQNDGTVPADYDVTAINGGIRRFLNLFERRAYVGYTATPFANVFIHPEGSTSTLGEDLFPDAFIINLPAPSTYIGPAQVFGLKEDPESEVEANSGMDIVREVSDQELWMPAGHKRDHVPPCLPPSLTQSLRVFVLSCAARAARGQQSRHKSMLIHVTRFQDVQAHVAELVKIELRALLNRLEFEDTVSEGSIREELERLWLNEFVETSRRLGAFSGPPLAWEEINPHLFSEANKIQIRTINGAARDALEYKENERDGFSVIAIGGDKLSRGLTLEGLSISYYLRASRMYDTLMQMGRWFGYRPGYADLCRLYTSYELADWYRDITIASEELRQEFDIMAALGQTPKEYGLKVRAHPNGLLITAANKLRNGTTVNLSYQGSLSETIVFSNDSEILKSNLRALEVFIQDMGGARSAKPAGGGRINYSWSNIPGTRIADFLEAFRTHPASRKARTPLLAKYVRAQLSQGELTKWVVAVVFKERGVNFAIGDIRGGLISRGLFPKKPQHLDRYTIRQLHSPPDELIDLTADELSNALMLHLPQPEDGVSAKAQDPTGPAARLIRPKERGLLLIYPLDLAGAPKGVPPLGLVLSFPGSNTAKTIEYVVNNVYWDQEFGD